MCQQPDHHRDSEPAPNAAAIIRTCAGLVALAMFYVAILEWTVGASHRPGLHDGLAAPFGNTQFYFATAAAVASFIAGVFCFIYAGSEERAGATWISLMVAVTLGIVWRIVLVKYCPVGAEQQCSV